MLFADLMFKFQTVKNPPDKFVEPVYFTLDLCKPVLEQYIFHFVDNY